MKEIINGVTYFDGILLANKSYSLPKDFGGINKQAEEALNKMIEAAKKDGIHIFNFSGYRSFDFQYEVYWKAFDNYGREYAEKSIARPGFSEHQTGLAFDINGIDPEFEIQKEGIWCKEHAREFGFILRYPKGKEHITGYKFEPWHFRYVGIENAKKIEATGLCLEEYFGIDSKYQSETYERD